MTAEALERYLSRPLAEADLAQAHALSRDASWPHRVEDWAFVLRLAASFGLFRPSGELVATAMWWPLGDRYAATGMIIVSRTARRQGLARRLLQEILAEAGQRSLTLNATQDGYRLYESVGFRPTRGIHQHQGLVSTAPAITEQVRSLSPADAVLVLALDRSATGVDRRAALQALASVASGVVLERANRPVGFAFIRTFGRGLVIGPVTAPDRAGAMALIGYWLARHAGEFVRVDIPDEDSALGQWLEQQGLARVDVVTTMWRGTMPAVDTTARVYGLVNQALG
ncbi:MAG: GNAT family N-acetyltransferase [Alphaproteobacteria bacterium]|nr:GNAT family N-acetyltransferase [Alphaproteobacteria bacterium]